MEQIEFFDDRITDLKKLIEFEKKRRYLWAFLNRNNAPSYHDGYLECLEQVEKILNS